ncbi:MAG TPA: hypothetical protein VG367_19000 [Mucilaginibacter sp.]|nr:hypothetical protein [Mucilaginibacter sp.]
MMPKCCLILLSTVCLFIFSCKKNGEKPSGPPSDIYNAGYIRANGHVVAAYWKNGTLVRLGDNTINTMAFAVAVDGNDIYVVGSINKIAQIGIAVIWKNGVLTQLTDGTSDADARSISISRHNVYVGGFINNFQAAYWKNGVVTSLANDAVTNSIAVEGNNVYAAGLIFDPTISNDEAVYWTNGTAKECIVSSVNDNSRASAIAVSGGDVYITGYANGGKYWKNGIETDLNNGGYCYPSAIAVIGSDVYLAGDVDSPAPSPVSTATFWKNGTALSLTRSTSLAHANAIALDRSDVYIAGQDDGNAVYWKNGSEVTLAANGGSNGVTIVQHYWQ